MQAGSGWGNGLLGVIIFSASLPATRVAVAGFSATFLTSARAVIAALLGVALLGLLRQRRPERKDLASLAIVSLGVVIGFPLLTALALWIRPLWFVQLLVVMALAGGVLSVLSIVWRLRQRERRGARGVPYGIAIALGGLWVLVCDYLPLAAARVG